MFLQLVYGLGQSTLLQIEQAGFFVIFFFFFHSWVSFQWQGPQFLERAAEELSH